MTYVATITSKRQLTIPSKIFREAGLREGERVLIVHKDGRIYVEPMLELVETLAGSIKVPGRFRSLSVDQLVQRTRKERFGKP